ncbi:hypothetical protein Pla100_30550 [Neorhodopirellula pilleata]|uniref:Uncharacterized protein n=1 Tax=Neorhodopirellula pilleata TaxID=2714738 RepID=A0A5C6A9A8_9BACT|nr:hypothetical protein Pla100_30550 [Neorhodopirellula pilleata]
MLRLLPFVILITSLITSLPGNDSAKAASPTGWSPIIIPTGEYRAQIQAMPIHRRPGRPLHVYGNTIRMIEQAQTADAPVRPLRQILFGASTLMPSRR